MKVCGLRTSAGWKTCWSWRRQTCCRHHFSLQRPCYVLMVPSDTDTCRHTNINMLGGDFYSAIYSSLGSVFCPVDNQSAIGQICENINIKVSRDRKHTRLIKEVGSQPAALFSAHVLRGRASGSKGSNWPQSLKRLALCDMMESAGIGWCFTCPDELWVISAHTDCTRHSTQILTFFILGKLSV